MSLHRFFGLVTEMPRPKGDAIKNTLAWAAQQKEPFTIRQLYDIYVANGGRENTAGDNKGSFSAQINRYVAKERKAGQKPKYGGGAYWPPSEKRPLTYAKQGSRGGTDPHLLMWAPNVPRPTMSSQFVNPEDDDTSGAAMDRLEKAMSRMGKGLPSDEKVGRQRAKDAIERWRKMGNLNRVVADIRATVPKIAQMDALHIASEFLVDTGKADEDDVEDAEDQVAPAPAHQQDDDEDYGDFSDEPVAEPEEYPEDDVYDEPEEEPEPAPTHKPAKPASQAASHIKVGDTVKRNWSDVTPAEKSRIKPHIMNATGEVVKIEQTPDGPAARVKWDYEEPGDKPYPFLLSELEPVDDEEPDMDELDPDDVEFDDEPEPETKQQAGAANFLKPQTPAAPKPAAPAAPKKPSSVAKFFKR